MRRLHITFTTIFRNFLGYVVTQKFQKTRVLLKSHTHLMKVPRIVFYLHFVEYVWLSRRKNLLRGSAHQVNAFTVKNSACFGSIAWCYIVHKYSSPSFLFKLYTYSTATGQSRILLTESLSHMRDSHASVRTSSLPSVVPAIRSRSGYHKITLLK